MNDPVAVSTLLGTLGYDPAEFAVVRDELARASLVRADKDLVSEARRDEITAFLRERFIRVCSYPSCLRIARRDRPDARHLVVADRRACEICSGTTADTALDIDAARSGTTEDLGETIETIGALLATRTRATLATLASEIGVGKRRLAEIVESASNLRLDGKWVSVVVEQINPEPAIEALAEQQAADPVAPIATGEPEALVRRFNDAWRRIESAIARAAEIGDEGTFGERLDSACRASALMRSYERSLRALSRTRNLIAHAGHPDGSPFVIPTVPTVELAERIAKTLSPKTRLIELLDAPAREWLESSDPVGHAVALVAAHGAAAVRTRDGWRAIDTAALLAYAATSGLPLSTDLVSPVEALGELSDRVIEARLTGAPAELLAAWAAARPLVAILVDDAGEPRRIAVAADLAPLAARLAG